MTFSPELTFNDGNTIPQLGYGVWQVEDDVAEKVVVQAFEAGFRHIDTAKIYGNEAGVGRAIERSGLKPEEIFITTKLWNADQGYESTLKAFEESMERLGLETLDLYLIHWMQPSRTSTLTPGRPSSSSRSRAGSRRLASPTSPRRACSA